MQSKASLRTLYYTTTALNIRWHNTLFAFILQFELSDSGTPEPTLPKILVREVTLYKGVYSKMKEFGPLVKSIRLPVVYWSW